MNKSSFNKENPTELFSQLVKVLSREKDRGKVENLIKDLKSLSSQVYVELKKPKLAKGNEMEEKISKIVKSIYYYDKPNIFRPNFRELDSKIFFCPRCKSQLSVPRNRVIKLVYLCPTCNYKIPHEHILKTKQEVEEYMVENKKRKKNQTAEIINEIMKEAFLGRMMFGGWMKKMLESSKSAKEIVKAALDKFYIRSWKELKEFKGYWKKFKKNKKFQEVMDILTKKLSPYPADWKTATKTELKSSKKET